MNRSSSTSRNPVPASPLASRDLEDIGAVESSRSSDPTAGKNRLTSFDGNPYYEDAPPESNAWKGSWRWDIRTDTTLWSEQLCRIIGRENTTMPPFREHFRFYTSESWIRLVDATLELLKTGAPYELRLQMLHTDGSRKWVICKGEPLGNGRGEIVELRGTVLDVTERDITESVFQAGNDERGLQTESNAEDATRRLIRAQEEENARLVLKFRDNICQRLALLAAQIQSFRSAFSDLHPRSDTQSEPLWPKTAGIPNDLDLRKPNPSVDPSFND
jgi:PAS fold